MYQPAAFEMTGHDWVAVARRTRVQLVVQPGVPPLLFVSEGRWGPRDWEGGKRRAPRPTRPSPSVIGSEYFAVRPGQYCVYCILYFQWAPFHVQGVEGLRRPEPGLCLALPGLIVCVLSPALESICLPLSCDH